TIYWQPVYVYIRRKGHPRHQAADLTQSFFLKLCGRDSFASAREEKGRFRNFLLVSLNRFLHDSWRFDTAARRQPEEIVFLDVSALEEALKLNSAAPPPDLEFDQNWTRSIVSRAMVQLQEQYRDAGKAFLWEHLFAWLTKDPDGATYEQAAGLLGMSNEALRKEVSRARKALRQCIVDQIAMTVSSPEQIEEELRHLFMAWGAAS
ncbi:MAG: RNA polymerase sigma factor, partial [Verrucomicrobiales bacterium]